MRRKYLLGATEDREIIFGEVEITQRNGYPEFTASFDSVYPFKGDEYDLTQYYEDWCDGMDKEYLYDLCETNRCSPQDLPEILADECCDVRDALDCSLYPKIIDVDGTNWYFESGSCGQYDTRKKGMDEYTNKEAYDLLHELWDEYHLDRVSNEVVDKVNKLIDMLEEVNEEEWIEDYIRRNF